MADAAHFTGALEIDARDVLLAAGPMSHMYTFGLCVMVPLLSGATCVTMRRFQAKLLYQAVREHRVTIFPAAPAMLDVLLFGAGDRLRHFVRRVLVAGAPLPEKTAQLREGRRGDCPAALRRHRDRRHHRGRRGRVGRVRPLRGPAHAGRGGGSSAQPALPNLPEGTGTVCVRSASLMAGYVARSGLDTSPLQDGWFRTGDLAERTAAGGLCLKGRENDVINVAGLKVVPREVEDVIGLLPGVVEVQVYAGVYPSGSQYVKAAVVAEPPVDAAAVRAHCQQNLVYYKRPEHIVLLDALPRSATGKIVCNQLP